VQRIALVIHPSRPIEDALQALRDWADAHDVEAVQLELPPGNRQVADLGDAGPCDLVVALGGDGTVLTALRASAPTHVPVLGVACGSLGALTATPAEGIDAALDRFAAGDWTARELPALGIESDGGSTAWAINDFTVTRGETGQLVAEVSVDGELYVRLAGDGVIVATVTGSSAYSMAAGGPVLAGGTEAFVCTPLAMHGGNAPPLVVPGDAVVEVLVHPNFARFGIDVDGHPHEMAGERFEVRRHGAKVRLVAFNEETARRLTSLRARGLITDSPRVLERDARTVAHR
jgi:NAD+ kinase